MTVTNVSTYGSLQTLLQNMSQTQNSLNNDSIEVSSGQASQTFEGISSSVQQLTSLNAQLSRLNNYQQNNSVVVSQLQSTSTILSQLEQVATSIKSLIAGQLGSTTSSSAASFQQQLQAYQTTFASELNSTYEGNYIFSGTATNVAPVQTPVPSPNTIGVPDDSYYQGSAQDSTLTIADGQTLTNSIRADNTAFQQIFAGISQALQPGASTTDLQNAENLVSSGVQGVISLQATVNANTLDVQQVDSQNQTLQTYYTSLSQNITQADVVSVSTQVAQDQTVLEASFEAYSRISSLTLATYLQ